MSTPTDRDEGLWTHTVRFDAALRGLDITLSADEAMRQRIAAAFGMVSLESLSVRAVTRTAKSHKPMVSLRIDLTGEVTQECGVSLEPFSHAIAGELTLDIIEAAHVTDEVKGIGEAELSLGDLDEPDVIDNGQIDLGQYAIEALGEAYDPFARKPGVVFEEPEPEREPSPFAVLAKLKRDE